MSEENTQYTAELTTQSLEQQALELQALQEQSEDIYIEAVDAIDEPTESLESNELPRHSHSFKLGNHSILKPVQGGDVKNAITDVSTTPLTITLELEVDETYQPFKLPDNKVFALERAIEVIEAPKSSQTLIKPSPTAVSEEPLKNTHSVETPNDTDNSSLVEEQPTTNNDMPEQVTQESSLFGNLFNWFFGGSSAEIIQEPQETDIQPVITEELPLSEPVEENPTSEVDEVLSNDPILEQPTEMLPNPISEQPNEVDIKKDGLSVKDVVGNLFNVLVGNPLNTDKSSQSSSNPHLERQIEAELTNMTEVFETKHQDHHHTDYSHLFKGLTMTEPHLSATDSPSLETPPEMAPSSEHLPKGSLDSLLDNIQSPFASKPVDSINTPELSELSIHVPTSSLDIPLEDITTHT